MKEYNKLLLALSMASKVIIKPEGAETIKTVKNVTKENFNKLTIQHLLGQTRLGITPEILRQEDKVSFGVIDIDLPDISHEEKYKIALSLQDKLHEDYRLIALIETSKSKGFHVWVPVLIPQERSLIKNILQDVINSVTDRPISNGVIEVFPKGDKGNAIFLPFFGMFKNENTLNENYFAEKKNTFVKGKKMKLIKNPLEAIHQAMRQNDTMLPILKELSIYPECVRKAFFEWKKGNRHYLTMAIAGILKKVCKVSEDETINLIKSIAQHNHDEEINDRISTVKSTYKSEEIAGCSIMQGKNLNIALIAPLCETNCHLIDKNISIKGKIRELQLLNKGQILKDKIVQVILRTIEKEGKIYRSNHKFYLFLENEREVIPIIKDSIELMNLMTKWGVNASENLYKYVYHELIAYSAEKAINVDIHRFAYYDKKNFVLYLYTAPKAVLKISPEKIEIVRNGDDGILFEEWQSYEQFQLVKFDKNKNYLLDVIIKDLKIDESNPNINLRKVLEIWFYSLFFESIMPTKPLLVAIGEKGSGKSSILKRSGQLLMGQKFNVTFPDNKNLITLITNNYLVVLDNMDSPTTQINDTLARVATGQVIKTRDYYTTNKQVEFESKCYVALTSRKPQFTRDDVADRLLCIFLSRFIDKTSSEGGFEAENEIEEVTNDMRNEAMSYVVANLQKIIGNLRKNKDKKYKHVFRIADFSNFAFKSANNEREVNELKKMFSALAKQQKEFAIQDDIIYTLLQEIVSSTFIRHQKFSSAALYKEFKHKAEELELDKFFNSIYSNPKALTTHLMNIKSNVANEIIINRQKGHANNYYYSFVRVDETKPLSANEAIKQVMNRTIEEQIQSYDKYANGNDEDIENE